MSKKIAEEIFEEIRKKNETSDNESIPHSDEFIQYLNASIGIDPELSEELIKVLINSHKLFSIEIVGEDKKNNIPRIEGYVESNLIILKKLKNYYQSELERIYESENYKRLTYFQIVKEIMPIMNTLNNTPLGQMANKAIMMGELERLLEKNYEEYTEEWKDRHFEIELGKINFGHSKVKKIDSLTSKDNETIDDFIDPANSKRPDVEKSYTDFISKSKNYPLDRILKIYGIDFFLRSQIRKNQFVYLTRIVEDARILKNSELLLLKELLYKLKRNAKRVSVIRENRDEIYGLERAIIHRLYFGYKYKHE